MLGLLSCNVWDNFDWYLLVLTCVSERFRLLLTWYWYRASSLCVGTVPTLPESRLGTGYVAFFSFAPVVQGVMLSISGDVRKQKSAPPQAALCSRVRLCASYLLERLRKTPPVGWMRPRDVAYRVDRRVFQPRQRYYIGQRATRQTEPASNGNFFL
jgi:hypothetical protein